MRFLFLTTLFAFLLTGCLEEAQSSDPVTEPAVEDTSLTQAICEKKHFPGGIALQAANHPYSKACSLQQLSGIQIAGVKSIHLCQSELFHNDFSPANKKFSAEDVKALLGDKAEKADLLVSAGFAGKSFAVLILNDGQSSRILATREELAKLPVTLETTEGALAWAYLSGTMGRGMGSGYAPGALCGADLAEDADGWTLTNAEIFQNCQPKELRDIRITRKGQVSILKKTVKTDSPALCID